MKTLFTSCRVMIAFSIASVASAQSVTVINDDLNMDSSADYTVRTLNNDGTVSFAFDYSHLGIPVAPRTTDDSTVGLKITANDTQGIGDAYTLFHNTPVQQNARVTVDLYLGVTGTTGTTEFGSIGLGSTGNAPFSIFTPISGDGTYLSTNGDGDSASDWRFSRPSGNDPSRSFPVNANQPDYLYGGTNAPLYASVLPPDGIAGNEWVTISMETIDGTTEAFINDTKIISGPSIGNADGTNTSRLPAPGGFASMSYGDVFTSIASPFQSQFGVFDNFLVENLPAPPPPPLPATVEVSDVGNGKFDFTLNVAEMEGAFDTVELVIEGPTNQDPAGGDGSLIMSSDTDSGFMATLTAPTAFGGQGLSAFGVDASTDTETGISGTFASLGSNDASTQGNYQLAQVVSQAGGSYRYSFFDDGAPIGSGAGIWGTPPPVQPATVEVSHAGTGKFDFTLNVAGMEGAFDTIVLVIEGPMDQDPAGGDGSLILSSDTDSGFMATLTAPTAFGGQGLSAFGVDASTDTETGISGTFASLGSNDASTQGNYQLAQVVSTGRAVFYRWEFYDDGTIVGEGSSYWGFIPEPTSIILVSLGVLVCIAGPRPRRHAAM